jgi:tetratricopeptide (TPR) repeat protein
VTLADSSSVIPLPDVMVEHRCYLATIGALTALVCCVDLLRTWLAERDGLEYVIPVFATAWVVILAAATFARNEVWRSEITNWTDAAAKSPKKFRPMMNLGVAYVEQGKPKEGVACFRKALQIEPALISGYENLATVENTLGNFSEALLATRIGQQYAPQSCKLHFNKAVAYNGLGQTPKAVEWFQKTVALNPAHKQSHLALGVIYTNLKQYDDALKHYRIAASLPTFREFDAQVRFNIAQIEHLIRQRAGPPVAMSGQ